jgi:hypothetical protein
MPTSFDLVGRIMKVTGGDRVIDRLEHQPLVREPRARSPVQVGDQIAAEPLELTEEHVLKQVVIAKPDEVTVKWYDEEICALELTQRLTCVRSVRHRLTQRPRQPLQDGRPHQELTHGRRLSEHDFVPEVIHQEAIIPLRAAYYGVAVDALLERQGGEI